MCVLDAFLRYLNTDAIQTGINGDVCLLSLSTGLSHPFNSNSFVDFRVCIGTFLEFSSPTVSANSIKSIRRNQKKFVILDIMLALATSTISVVRLYLEHEFNDLCMEMLASYCL